MKMRYFAGIGVILALAVCFLVDRNVVSGDSFSTGATTNTIPGSLIVTGAAQFNSTISLTNDIFLARDAANTLALRNGGTAGAPVPQTLNLYNFFQDASNYERLAVYWSGNQAQLLTLQAGTGSARAMTIGAQTDLNLFAGGAVKWVAYRDGTLFPNSDNGQDIGYAGGGAVRKVFVGTSIFFGTNVLSFSGTNLTWNGTTITIP